MTRKGQAFSNLLATLEIAGQTYQYYDLTKLDQDKYNKLPFSIRILLESAIRSCDGFQVKEKDVDIILNWEHNQSENIEIPFNPSRVILQDLTGVPAVVDFAAMRDAFQRLGGNPEKVNPLCPTDLVIDHSVQVDYSRTILNMMRSGTGKFNGKDSTQTPELCDDCQKTGKCMLAGNLIKSSVPVRSTSNGKSTNSIVIDIESWIPHSFDKLRQDSCPFHRQQSLGLAP